jgi:hypothetical protein
VTIIVAPKSGLAPTRPSVGIFWRVNGVLVIDRSTLDEAGNCDAAVALGPDATLVEREHRNFERMGAEAGASMRKDIDGGWPSILEAFRRETET